MNMGGGMLIRTVGRAAGSTNPAASTSFCSACSGRVPRPSSLRTGGFHNATLPHQAVCTGTDNELEDWELADDSVIMAGDSSYRSRFFQDSRWLFPSVSSLAPGPAQSDATLPSEDLYRHVFGFPPTFDEALEATSELQAAFMESISTNDNINNGASVFMTSEPGLSGQTSHDICDCEQKAHLDGWIEPDISSNLPVTQVVNNPVYEAFQLLQNNSHVKDAVMSLASDSNVWHAMMKNKEMQELRQKLKNSEHCLSKQEEHADTFATLELRSEDEGENPFGGVPSALRAIVKMSMGIVCRVQNGLTKFLMLIMSVLNGTNNSLAKEAPVDKASSSTMMLAMLVVAVVLVKRLTA